MTLKTKALAAECLTLLVNELLEGLLTRHWAYALLSKGDYQFSEAEFKESITLLAKELAKVEIQ